ncbi:hypothetical protein COCON_G00100390 [Conger conger]|uniref:Cadherin domain-containing protein n=1 Tax=Conger conger TaxID=82655 RepID=A0A9Q1DHL8_CONCO|nr:hypothetical protein COCON_G00100390 [Conger conger]
MDRESLAQCERVFEESECFVEFEVCVIGPEQSWVRLWEGRLVVLDVNDHTPSFPSPALSVSVEENQPIGTLYLLPTATDRDFGPNGVQWYELLQGAGRGRGRGRSSVFQLQVADTPEGGKQPQLIVKGDLDRERRDAYDLILRASDGGTPPRTTQASLRISVTDANDNSPRFERAQYEAELDENAAVGVSVLQVRAVDLDVGANGQVQYALAPGPGFQGAGHFLQVEAGSGWISVRQPIDREETAQLRFAITASDRGQPALSATATVLLQVRDLNDNAPTVEIRKIGRFTLRQGVARVPEDVVVDTPVALVQVWDRDAGRNGEVTCTLVGDVPFQLRPAGGAVGGAGGGASGRKFLLHTAAALDHEVATAHRLLVVAVDAGSPALTGSGALTVEVGDVNDHAPVFLRGALEAALRENNAPGETLAKAEALDADSGRNGEVLYSLDPSAHALFSINPALVTSLPTPCSTGNEGTDRGVPGLQSSAPVRVRVLDMNDNSPAFPHHAFTFYAPENLPEHSSVGTVTATDADAGRNAELSLFISQEEDEEEGMFFISNATGTIFCRRMLDREAQAVHRFGVIAVDGGDPPRSCSTTVTLFVTDKNDNPPSSRPRQRLLHPAAPVQPRPQRSDQGGCRGRGRRAARWPWWGLGPGHGGLHRLVLRVSDRGSPPLHTTTLVHVFVNHTLGNGTWVQEAVARSLALPLSQNVAGDGLPGWVHPQGLSLAIGALAGGVAVLLLIMLVVTVTHCTPGSRKGYRVGRREEGEEGANVAEGDRKTVAGRYSAVREGSPDLARHYTLTPPLPALSLPPHPLPTHPHLPPANTFVSMATQCHPERSYQSDNMYSKPCSGSVAVPVSSRLQDPGCYDSGLEDSDTPSSTSSTPLAPPPPDLAPPPPDLAPSSEHHEWNESNVANTEPREHDCRMLPDVAMTGKSPSAWEKLPHTAPCCLQGRATPTGLGHTHRKMTSPWQRMTSWSYDSVRAPAQRPRPSAFAALAKHLLMQEKMKASEEPPAGLATPHTEEPVKREEEEEEEEVPFEELGERAKAGDAKAQASLGQYYLKLPDEGDVEANSRKAVDWLIKAAKQGSKRAAKLLRHCLTYKKGITAQNEEEMKKLASESRFEQAVRKAAMMMYWKLNPDKKQKVAVTEMLEHVQQDNSGAAVADQKRVLENMVSSKTGEYVGLEDFVEITKNFTQGIAPSPTLDSSREHAGEKSLDEKEEPDGLKESAYHRMLKSDWGVGGAGLLNANSRSAMTRAFNIKSHFLILQYPVQVLVQLKEHLIDWASRAGLQWLSTIIPTHHVNALIFFFIISNLTIHFFAFIIPLFVFYLSFVSMLICTLRVFQNSKAWENFRALTTLLSRYEPGLDLEQAETNFGWNNLEPYLYFLLSVFFVIFSFPLADKAWIPCSELAMVAMFFTVASCISLRRSAGLYMRRALVVEVASTACTLMARLPESMALARSLGVTFVTLPLGEWVELHVSVPCLLYLYLFYLFFRMAQMRGFRGTYCVLVPYLVCFTWCEFAGVLLQSATAVGVLRTLVACFLLLFALPVLALGLAAVLLVQAGRWLLELQLTRLLVTLAVCAVPVTLRLWTRFSLSPLDVLRALARSSAVKLLLFWASAALLFCCVYVLRAEGLRARESSLSWQQYGQACGPPAWRENGLAHTQIFCSHLEGHRVHWAGRILAVAVSETENGPQAVINLLPSFAGDWLRCLYGEAYPDCGNATAPAGNATAPAPAGNTSTWNSSAGNATALQEQQEQRDLCRLKALTRHDCHVKRFDSHRFLVTVSALPEEGAGLGAEPVPDIVLRASGEFRQVLLSLELGGVVEFSAVLESRLGSTSPALQLQAIQSRALAAQTQHKIEPDWRGAVLRAVKFAFDFFFSPILSARIRE